MFLIRFIVLLISLSFSIYAVSIEHSGHSKLNVLSAEISRLVEYKSYDVSFAAYHIESNRYIYINGNQPFPMASIVKVIIACTYLDLVDQQKLDPNKTVSISKKTLRPYSVFAKLFLSPNFSLSLNNLLEAMMIYSDNTATDILFHEIGGKKAIKAFLKQHDITGIDVSRSILEIIAQTDGVAISDDQFITLKDYYDKRSFVSLESEEKARQVFFSSKKDTTSAKAFLNFLLKFHNQELLSKSSTDYLRKIMFKNAHGNKRLKDYLPNASFSHKTGSLSMLSNDAGILKLPGNKGHIVLVGSVLERQPQRLPDAKPFIQERENILAIMAKTVYDFFLFSD